MVTEICLLRGRISEKQLLLSTCLFVNSFTCCEDSVTHSCPCPFHPAILSRDGEAEVRREALTPHSTHLGPGCRGLARAGGLLWGTGHSHCMFPQKTCQQRKLISHLGRRWRWQGKASYADSAQFQSFWSQILRPKKCHTWPRSRTMAPKGDL